MHKQAFATAVFAVAAFATAAQAQDEMSMDEAPAEARAAARAAAPGMSFDSVGLDLDGGQATYEFAGKNADGMTVEVDVLADGQVLEIERQIDMSEVPSAVKTLLDRYAAGMQPEMIEESTHANFEIWYEFGGTLDGSEIDAEVSADGKRIMIQDDQAG